MDGERAENILTGLYSFSSAASLTCIVCLAVAWQHWSWTLDTCLNVNCGCILFGMNTFSQFMGGNERLCHFAVLAPVPIMLIGIGLAFWHGYRSCIPRSLSEPRAVAAAAAAYRNRNSAEGHVIVVGPKQRAPCKQWTPAAFLAVLVCCLALAHAVVITDGYFKTCSEYRKNLVRLLGSTGRESLAIHNRLGCGAILDYMDYIQPDANNYRRADEINTGLALQIGLGMSWFNFFSWVTIFLVNISMARQRMKSLNESCCW